MNGTEKILKLQEMSCSLRARKVIAMSDVRKHPRSQYGWGLYNWGLLRGVYHTRKQARAEAEHQSGHPWSECRAYFETHKVYVVPLEVANSK